MRFIRSLLAAFATLALLASYAAAQKAMPSLRSEWKSRQRSAQSSAISLVETSTSASPAAARRSGSAGSSPGAP